MISDVLISFIEICVIPKALETTSFHFVIWVVFSSQRVTQQFWGCQVECLVYNLIRMKKFYVDNFFLNDEKKGQQRLDIGLYLTHFWEAWWYWMHPLAWLLLRFQLVGMAPDFVTSDTFLQRVNFTATTFLRISSLKVCWQELLAYQQLSHIYNSENCSATVLQNQLTNFRDVFHSFVRSVWDWSSRVKWPFLKRENHK